MAESKEWVLEDLARIDALREAGKQWDAIGLEYGLTGNATRKRYRSLRQRVALDQQVSSELRTVEGDENNPRIASILAKAEVNLEEWEVVRAVVNEWGGAGTSNPPNFQAKAWLRRIAGAATLTKLAERLLDQIEERAAAITPVVLPYNPMTDPHLLEVSPFDLHVGKLAWAEETGESYDTDIAADRFAVAIEDLLRKAAPFGVERIVLPVGSDLMHIDNLQNTTTRGTLQDVDTRYIKIFLRSCELMSWAIRRMLQVAPVDVIVVPGNHDRLAAFHVGEVLRREFAGAEHATVDNAPTMRKYVQYGTNLIGFTHGNEERLADLPLLMADEVPEYWAETTHREWHVGHVHRKRQLRWTTTDTFGLTSVRILPSLSGTDAWHHSKGYRSMKQAEAYLWSRDGGYAGHFSHTARKV